MGECEFVQLGAFGFASMMTRSVSIVHTTMASVSMRHPFFVSYTIGSFVELRFVVF